LKNPESVIYSPKQDILFVSNIDGKPNEKDQKGFISKVSPSNGNIIELSWITGLNAPKGMAIYNNTKLYVSDILNDVASDNHGNIYVSDIGTNTT
jgi:hypothetical protein